MSNLCSIITISNVFEHITRAEVETKEKEGPRIMHACDVYNENMMRCGAKSRDGVSLKSMMIQCVIKVKLVICDSACISYIYSRYILIHISFIIYYNIVLLYTHYAVLIH